jgi:acyl carrier protein
MVISSRTPEGEPNSCPVCHATINIEPSQPSGDAPCPNCGHLLWFNTTSAGIRLYDAKAIAPIRDKIIEVIHSAMGLGSKSGALVALAGKVESIFPTRGPFDPEPEDYSFDALGADSLDIVEMIMELEEKFDIQFSDEEAEQIKSMGDAIDLINRKLNEKRQREQE